jgi:hypothetical protein
METEQMMACLLAEIRNGQEHMQEMMHANQAKIKAEMKADREEMMAWLEAKIEANQAKTGVNQEEMKAQMVSLISRIENNNEKFEVLRDNLVSCMDAHQESMMACLGKTKATDLEANPEEMQSGAKHEKVPKKHTAVKPVGGLRKRHRGQNLAAERRPKPKARTPENCGSQKKLAAARRRTTSRAKWHGARETSSRKNQTRDKTGRGTSKRGALGRRHQPKPERKNGIRNHGLRQQLRTKREFNKALRKTLGLEIMKREVGISSDLREMRNWTLWRGRPPPKQKKNLPSTVTAR